MLAAYDLFTTWNSDQSTSQKIQDTGNIAGGMGGAALGAAIGTAILPGVGTIIGGLLGGLGGELAGGELSQKLSTYLDINVKDDRTEVKARGDAAQHTDISGSTMLAH
ncbi:glycine zipper domain-containing protein [Aliamphritea spongicola]|nr:glycine zipper domain-containing protein [Aliamphritea spongicola]